MRGGWGLTDRGTFSHGLETTLPWPRHQQGWSLLQASRRIRSLPASRGCLPPLASLYPRFCHHVALPHACLCPNVPLIHKSTIRWVTSHVTPVHLHPNCISTDPISNQGHIWRYCPLGLQHRILGVGWTQINTIPHPFPQRLANTPCFLSLCLLWTFPINGIPSVVAFCVWLLSLNTVFRPCCSMCRLHSSSWPRIFEGNIFPNMSPALLGRPFDGSGFQVQDS